MIPSFDLYDLSIPPDPKPPATRGSVPWSVLETEFLELYGPAMRSPKTRNAMARALLALAEIGVEQTTDLTVGRIATLVSTRSKRISPNTVRALLRDVQVIANFCVDRRYLDVSPFKARPIGRWVRAVPTSGKSHCSAEEMKRIFNVLAADVEELRGWAQWRARRLQFLACLCAYTGVRLGEALWGQVDDLDCDARIFYVRDRPRVHRTKTDKSHRPITLPGVFLPIARSWLEHRQDAPLGYERAPSQYLVRGTISPNPWTGGERGQRPIERLRAIGRRALVDGLTYRLLRRSYATRLEGAGAGQLQVMRLLGHSNPRTAADFYLKSDIANMRLVTDGFDY